MFIECHRYKSFFTLLILFSFLMAACAFSDKPTKYSTETYPDSYLAEAMESANIHPETLAKRLLGLVKAEILAGKFTRDEVLKWCAARRAILEEGATYTLLKTAMDEYFREAIQTEDELISQTAIITYALFVPEIPDDLLDASLLTQDRAISLRLLDYIIAGVTGMPAAK